MATSPQQLLNECELAIQALCEGFEARDLARQEMHQRMVQAVKAQAEREVRMQMENEGGSKEPSIT